MAGEDEGRSRPRRSRRRRRGRVPSVRVPPAVAIGGLFLALAAGPLLFGGAFGWSASVIAGLSVAALLLAVLAFGTDNDRGLGWPFAVFSGAVAWTAIQAMPLPCSFVGVLSARAEESARAAADLLGAAPICTISIDPGATLSYLVGAAAVMAAWLAGWLAATRGCRRQVYLAAVASVLVFATITFLHLVLGMEEVFGVYAPRFAHPSLLSPLLNENHLGGFLVFGVPILVVLGLDASSLDRKIFWWGGAGLVGGLVLMTLSRGAMAALFGALVLLPFVLRHSSNRERRGERAFAARAFVGAGIVLALAAALGVYIAGSQIRVQLEREDSAKFDLVASALRFALEAPAVGYGRGGLSSAFVQEAGTLRRFVHAENFVAQWIADWGFAFAAFAIFLLGRALMSAFRSRKPLDQGVAVALLALTAHNLVDFSFEMVGIAIVPAAAFGALLAPRRGRPPSRFQARWVAPLALVAAAACAIYPGIRLQSISTQSLQDRLSGHLERGDHHAFSTLLAEAVRLHPAEPAFALLAGSNARIRDGDEAIRWLNRAMALAPGWSLPHVEAAIWLLQRGRDDQALLEIRQAATLDVASARDVVCALLEAGGGAEVVLRAAPLTEDRGDFIEASTHCLPANSDVVADLDAELLRQSPELVEPLLRRAARLFAVGDADGAIDLVKSLAEDEPDNVHVRRQLIDTLIRAEQPDSAVVAAEHAERDLRLSRPERRVFATLRARAEARAGDLAAMRLTIQRLKGLADGSPQHLSSAMRTLAILEYRAGNQARALRAYEDAYGVDAETTTLRRIARLAVKLGNTRRAYHAYAELCGIQPEHVEYCREKERLRGEW